MFIIKYFPIKEMNFKFLFDLLSIIHFWVINILFNTFVISKAFKNSYFSKISTDILLLEIRYKIQNFVIYLISFQFFNSALLFKISGHLKHPVFESMLTNVEIFINKDKYFHE